LLHITYSFEDDYSCRFEDELLRDVLGQAREGNGNDTSSVPAVLITENMVSCNHDDSLNKVYSYSPRVRWDGHVLRMEEDRISKWGDQSREGSKKESNRREKSGKKLKTGKTKLEEIWF